MQTDDLAAQMVREMGFDGLFDQDVIEEFEAIARRYMENLFTEDEVRDAIGLASVGFSNDECIGKIRAERAWKEEW